MVGRVRVRDRLASGRLYISALGVCNAFLNGVRIGQDELTPGWTSYDHRIRYHGYDVTNLLRGGDNRVEVLLGNGWYRGQLGNHLRRDFYSSRLAVLAQFELCYEDGRVERVGSDASWRARESHVLSDDLYDGQSIDLRRSETPTDQATDDVDVLDVDLNRLVPPEAPPPRITDQLPAQELVTSPSGATIVDFGQNLVGWVRLCIRGGSHGDTVTVRHAEVLEQGELCVRTLRQARATDTYVLAGPGEIPLEPSLTFHGFRYAEVSGNENLELADVSAAVVGSDLVRTGWFECSDPLLNKFHENVVWGMRGNFLAVPTDCPQRDERLGWTGDLQVFAPAATFLYDVNGFLSSWLRDLAADQHPDGGVPVAVPDVLRHGKTIAAGWSDAACVVPWTLYERYGDIDVLERQFPSMKAWADRLHRDVDPNGLWLTGFQYGDWLDPTTPPDKPADAKADKRVVQQAHLVRTNDILAQTAATLGYADQAEEYSERARLARQSFAKAYVGGQGLVTSDCQTVYALALCWDLLPTDSQRDVASRRLAELVREAGARVATGFLGTPLILDALVQAGEPDLAYAMLLQTQPPSWLYPVTMGATTIWERWMPCSPTVRSVPAR